MYNDKSAPLHYWPFKHGRPLQLLYRDIMYTFYFSTIRTKPLWDSTWLDDQSDKEDS